MSYLKLQVLIQKMKSKEPYKRYEAIMDLMNMKMDEVSDTHLQMLFKEAAGAFPDPVDEWDYPSYALVEFATQYTSPILMKPISKYFHHYHPDVKALCLTSLVEINTKESVSLFLDLFEQHGKEEWLNLPYSLLEEKPEYANLLFPRLRSFIEDKRYGKNLLLLMQNYLVKGELKPESETVYEEAILFHLQTLKKEYLSYDKDYEPTFARKFWKDTYFPIRVHLHIFIRLAKYYPTEAILKELKELLPIKDKVLQSTVVGTLLQLKQEVQKEFIMQCADNLESRLMFYEELKNNDLLHIYPADYLTMEHFVEAEINLALLNDEEFASSPSTIKVLKSCSFPVGEEEAVYYPVLFTSNKEDFVDKGTMWAISGPYMKKELPTPYFYGESYVEFDTYKEEKVKEFLSNEEERSKVVAQQEDRLMGYSQAPMHPFLILFSIYFGLRTIAELFQGDTASMYVGLGLFLMVAIQYFRVRRISKKSLVFYFESGMIYDNGVLEEGIPLYSIGKVELEKRKVRPSEKSYFYKGTTSYVVFYDHNGEEIMSVPEKYIDKIVLRNYLTEHGKIDSRKIGW